MARMRVSSMFYILWFVAICSLIGGTFSSDKFVYEFIGQFITLTSFSFIAHAAKNKNIPYVIIFFILGVLFSFEATLRQEIMSYLFWFRILNGIGAILFIAYPFYDIYRKINNRGNFFLNAIK